MSLEDLKKKLKPEGKATQQAPKQEKGTAQVGQSIGQVTRNPLEMIKRDPPLLSADKSRAPARPLGPLLDAAGRDEACVWYRVSPPCALYRTGVIGRLQKLQALEAGLRLETWTR